MGRDKKATAGFILILDGPVGPEIVSGVPTPVVLSALQATAAHGDPDANSDRVVASERVQ